MRNNFVRSVLGIVAGLAVAIVILVVVETVSTVLFPLPAGVDVQDPAALSAAMQQLPIGAYLMVLLGWALGSLAGAWVASRIAGRSHYVHGMVVGLLLLAAGVANLLALPHPWWMWVGAVIAFLGAAYAGSRLARGTTTAGPSGSLI